MEPQKQNRLPSVKSLANSMQRSSNLRLKNVKREDNSIKKSLVENVPPHFDSQVLSQVRRRYNSTGAISVSNFTLGNGHDAFLVATTNILANSYVYAWRILKVCIWAPIPGAGAIGSCSLQAAGFDSGSNNFNDLTVNMVDTTSSYDTAAFVQIHPQLTEPMGSWHYTVTNNSTGNLFNYSMTQSATMDITFECIMNVVNPVTNYTRAVVGATAGTLYVHTFNANLVPFGVNSI